MEEVNTFKTIALWVVPLLAALIVAVVGIVLWTRGKKDEDEDEYTLKPVLPKEYRQEVNSAPNRYGMTVCPKCKMRIMPNADNTCPSCQAKLKL